MSRAKAATNFIHSYKGYMLIGGFILIFGGYALGYLAPRPDDDAQINTDSFKGMFPTMSIIGAGVLLIPYIAVYLIQTIASKFGKKTEPPAP